MQAVLDATLKLVAGNDKEAAAASATLLDSAMSSSVLLFRQVLSSLLTSYSDCYASASEGTSSAELEQLVDEALCKFVRSSFAFLLVTAAEDATRVARDQSRAIGADEGIDSLSLGDALELLVNNVWVVGTIVRSNALTGDLHIEHAKPGAGTAGAANNRGGAISSTVTVLHKSSSRLRPVPSSTAKVRQADTGSAPVTPAQPGPSASAEEAAMKKLFADLQTLVFGDGSFSRSSHNKLASKHRRSQMNTRCELDYSSFDVQLPTCENDHLCDVVRVPSTSAGFMCSYCSKLHPSSPDPSESSASGAPEGTAYKWTCAACHYDVCLTCFPHPSYPKDGVELKPGRGHNSAAASTSKHGRTATVEPAGTSSVPTSGVRCSICLMGGDEVAYCKVRAEASVTSTEVSRVSRGSVIDVIDVPGSDFFELISVPGYVKKLPGCLGHWKRLPRDRYMLYEEESVSIYAGEVELSRSANAVGKVHSDSVGGHAEQESSPEATATRVLELLIEYDDALKARFSQFVEETGVHDGADHVQDKLVAVLRAVRDLFNKVGFARINLYGILRLIHDSKWLSQTATPLGEMVMTSLDTFDDPVDDYFIASERVPVPTPSGGSAAAAAKGVSLLPAAQNHSATELFALLVQPGLALKQRISMLVVSNAFFLVTEVLTGLAEKRITTPDCKATSTELLAQEVVSLVANSAQHALLNGYFYRVMIVRAAVRAKLAMALFFHR
jgi:hypothetical protein